MAHTRSRSDVAASAAAGSKMEPNSQLTDEQWFLIADLFPDLPGSPKGGRPRAAARACFEGILWVLRTGARWKDLPTGFPSPTTCWRRHKQWSEDGRWEDAWARLLRKLDRAGRIKHAESIADGTFSSAKKRVILSVRQNEALAPRRWCSSTPKGCPWQRQSPAPVLMKSR